MTNCERNHDESTAIKVRRDRSNGYVGRAIGRRLRRDGCQVIDLCRRGDGVRTFSLEAAPTPELLGDVKALIHCAYDFAPADEAGIRRINIDGSIRLFEGRGPRGSAGSSSSLR